MKISVVIPTRNDNYGGNLTETATASVQTMSKTFDEVIVVDFGSTEPFAPILQATIKDRKENIRIIHVPRPWVLTHLANDSTFSDILARNIGIRRATHDVIFSSNIDIVSAPRHYFDFDIQFNEENFYASPKFMINRGIIQNLRNRGLPWEQIQEHLFQTRDTYIRQPLWHGDPWSTISGPGDFQGGHKKIWYDDEVRGFEETLIFRDYADSNLHKKVIENAHRDVLPALFFYLFHQSHADGRPGTKPNDAFTALHGFVKTTNKETWGFSEEKFDECLI